MKHRLLSSFPVRVVQRYLNAQGPNWATIIAWNALFAFFPIVLVTITVLGLVLHDPGIRDTVYRQVASAFPDCHGGGASNCQVVSALESFRRRTGLVAIIGLAGLFWSGSSLFGAIDQGLGSLYPCKPRDFLQQKLMAFAMILVFTVLTVPLLLSSSLLSLLESLPLVPHWLSSGPAALLIQLGAGIIDAALLFGAIYYVVPHRRMRIRLVVPGSLVAGALVEGFTLLFPAYFKLTGGFAQYGKTFALFFLVSFYLFVLGQIVMIGGAVNAELDPDLSRCDDGTGLPAGGLRGEALVADGTAGREPEAAAAGR